MGRTKEEAPKTYALRVTEHALQNLDNLTGYIAYIRHEPLNAIKAGDEILKTIERIEKNPFAFRECEEIPTINKIYRKAVCLSWLIIYKIKPAEIVILGIIHGHRKVSRIKSLRKVKE
jgi:plasmid stabilization system protein ParE